MFIHTTAITELKSLSACADFKWFDLLYELGWIALLYWTLE